MSFMLYLGALTALASFVLTWCIRGYALRRNVLDIPNARSSHAIPTPRGGGVAIVAAFALGLPLLWHKGLLPDGPAIALLGAGAWIAAVGFIDDHRHIPSRWRLLAHFAAACWVLYWLGGMPTMVLLGTTVDPGWFWHGVTLVYIVWMLNLYNFMDGIDGIASLEAITVCIGGVILLWLVDTTPSAFHAPVLLAAAVAGFLVWNFPRARIFMGDAGSGFIGITLATLSILAAHEDQRLFWGWLILLGVFVVDATLTLVRRMLGGQRFDEAHRTHAYQYAARRLGSHRPVSTAVALINLLWLLPLASLAVAGRLDGVVALAIAYLPLLVLGIRLEAGVPEPKQTGKES
ncbi:glycosyltransferase family 4 protein [Chitiniphilus purpureus]|uniref:Glycosyltransferase family 4 protein n=1 Tax=Chitiniphilus purpureus TaxID=2981137 RepID=A0ABY6DLW5_9NEIS|nr:glycosyltransferase family 4 protein [Chitiniphilus sp. CD1]UXY14471.1 glycosyltransferase family 4 protein [Chitiniphilus sp. CD1]